MRRVRQGSDAPTAENMFGGTVKANYRISSITVTLTQGDKTVQSATCYGHQEEMYEFNLYRFTNATEQPVIRGSLDLEGLKPGTYRCTFTAKLSTGADVVFRDFTVTK